MRDVGFRQKVLLTRAVTFPTTYELSDPFAHFETEEPSGSAGYQELAEGYHTEVWISMEPDLLRNVVREYTYMRNEQLCEAEFSTYAKETLLRRDPRYPSLEEARQWRTERMIELVMKPSVSAKSKWIPPPATVDTFVYDFDVRPDCQYWLSVRAFNPEYSRLFSRYVHVHNDRITCPYFTIEFKKDDSTLELAQNQMAAAAALALHNRALLKVERLKVTKKRWTEKHTSSLRHYGLTLHGHKYTFWCLKLKQQHSGAVSLSPKDWSWQGCDVVEATTGNMLTEQNVKHFIQWANEIHRWGLGVHGPSCQRDVQFCIEKEQRNVRTSLSEIDQASDSDDEADGEA
jgi:hypothetical protein